jgi:dUTP pyrophosphatase
MFSKLDEDAKLPERGTGGSVGWDVSAIRYAPSRTQPNVFYAHTGIKTSPPEGCHFELFARSSLHKSGWMLANGVGVIDPDYEGEVIVALLWFGTGKPVPPKIGKRIAQLVLKQHGEIERDRKLRKRGAGGFGSTD